jgi:sugar phosphate permease
VIGAGTLVIVVADGLVMLLAAVALVGMADSLMGPLQKSLLTQNVDEAHRAGVVTTNSVVQNAGKTVAPAVIGVLLFLDDLVWLYLVAALSFTSALLFSVICLLLRRESTIHQLVRRYRNEGVE